MNQPTNRIREKWSEKESALVSISGIVQTKDPLAIKLSAIKSVIDTYTERLLKSQAEQLEGIYGFSPDDWEKKKQELLKSQKESWIKACSASECELPDEGKSSRQRFYHITIEDYQSLIKQSD